MSKSAEKGTKSARRSQTNLTSPTKPLFSGNKALKTSHNLENKRPGRVEVASPEQLVAGLPDQYTVEHTIRDGSIMLSHLEKVPLINGMFINRNMKRSLKRKRF